MKKHEIIQRKKNVAELAKAGYSNYEIADRLKIQGMRASERTVRRDLYDFSEKLEKEGRIDSRDIYLEVSGVMQEIRRKTWEIVDNPETGQSAKLKALRILMESVSRNVEIVIKLGLNEKSITQEGHIITYEQIQEIMERRRQKDNMQEGL